MAQNHSKYSLSENLAQELRRGMLVLAVLTQLEEAQYGYSLKQRLAEKGMDIKEGTLYPLLRRLESQGVLESSWEIIDNARPRRYYKISKLGKQIQTHLKADWLNMIGVMDNLFASAK